MQDADPIRVAVLNLEALAFLVLFVVLTVIAWRRFGAPYGLFAALSLAIPLSVPSERWPLLSLPRFGLTIFPLFLALAVIGGRPRRTHRDRGRQLAPARGLGRAMGALAVGRVRAALVLSVAALLLLAGTACGERTEPTGALVASYPVTVQGDGDKPTVVAPRRRRIVPVGAGPKAILQSLGLGKRTVDGRRHARRPAARRRDPPSEAGPDRRLERDGSARPRPGAKRDPLGGLRRAGQLGRERRSGDRRPRPAHRPRGRRPGG